MAVHGLALAVVAGVVLTALVDGALYRKLLQEDGWGEWSTFLLFATAAGLGLRGSAGASDRLLRLVLLALSGFCLFVAGEEISWGQRLLGFQPPEVFLEHNYQQESNLHNLLTKVLDTRWVVLAVAAVYGVAAPLLVRARVGLPAVLAPPLRLIPWFASVSLLEAFYPFTLTGELAEMTLGLCFVADLSLRTRGERGSRTAVYAMMLPLGLAAALPLGIDSWTSRHAAEDAARARQELETLADDLRQRQVVQPLLQSKRRVHKRIFTAVRAGYLRFGTRSRFLDGRASPAERAGDAVRRDARGYFMDPWQQPYWVRYERLAQAHGRLLLYSFGANRRRDSAVSALAEVREGEDVLRGDDVGVALDVYWP